MATILPDGWFSKLNEDGYTYYYDVHGRVSWLPPPPRPKAPIKIRTFKDEYSPPIEEEESDDEVLDKWVEDSDDVGIPIELPLSAEETALRIRNEAESMSKVGRKISGRFDLNANTWGGEPHPRLGCGERMRLGYRPPPPWQPSDTVAAAAKSVSKNNNREWVVDGSNNAPTVVPNETFIVKVPIGGYRGVVVQVVASDEHSYLRTSEGFVYSWGRNIFGQLGLGDVETRAVPCMITALAEEWIITHLSCGGSHALALAKSRKPVSSSSKRKEREGNVLMSWGKGRDGALGRGTLIDGHLPQIVPLLADVPITCCSGGATTSLATTASGALYSWGNNTRGLCGLGDAPRTASAVKAASRQSRLTFHSTSPSSSSLKSGSPNSSPSEPTQQRLKERPETDDASSPIRPNTPGSDKGLIMNDMDNNEGYIDGMDDINYDDNMSATSGLTTKKEDEADKNNGTSRDGYLCIKEPTLCPTITKGVKLVSCGKFHSIILCNKTDAEECLSKAAILRKARRETERKARVREERKRRRAERAAIAAANGGNRRWSKRKIVPEESSDEDDDDEDEGKGKNSDDDEDEGGGGKGGGDGGGEKSISTEKMGEFSVTESFVESYLSSSVGQTEEFLNGFGPETRGSIEEVVDHMGSTKKKKLFYKGNEVVLLSWGYGNRAGLGLGVENSHMDVDVPTLLPIPIVLGDDDPSVSKEPWVRTRQHHQGEHAHHHGSEEVLDIATSCHSVLLTASDGGVETHVYTWGDADHGKCGIEPPKRSTRGLVKIETGPLDCVPIAVHVPTLVTDFEGKRVTGVSAGGFATAVCTSNGKVYACGFVGNKVTMDRVAQQREVLDNPRPRELLELTEPRPIHDWKGVDVIQVQLGMRHAIALTSHSGCLRELLILDNINFIYEKFNILIHSLIKLVELNIESTTSLKHSFDSLIPDSAILLQPLLDEAYERGLNGHPIVVKGEELESQICELKHKISIADDHCLRHYFCCCMGWRYKKVRKPIHLKRREKRIHNSNLLGPKASENGRSTGDPNFFDGAEPK